MIPWAHIVSALVGATGWAWLTWPSNEGEEETAAERIATNLGSVVVIGLAIVAAVYLWRK